MSTKMKHFTISDKVREFSWQESTSALHIWLLTQVSYQFLKHGTFVFVSLMKEWNQKVQDKVDVFHLKML